ncbi:MAG: hypothetical protein HYV08_15670, partial [Deltaproteobacteria bacterium]|nr:hypothetical protein [Deltaproteobacteria bacterium]
MSQTRALFRRYPHLCLWQRLFMASRLLILPLRALDAALPRAGRILDLGSGRGVLANWLSLAAR